MAEDGVIERRRVPRVDVDDQHDCRFRMRTRVRVLDISASGLLLLSERALPGQSAAQLKATLSSEPFSPTVEARRTSALPGGASVHVGVTFIDMDEGSRRSLDAFLRRAIS